MGFGTTLFLVFLVLKLTDKIKWSWWWVTAPLWVEAAILFAILGLPLLLVLFLGATT